MKYKKYIQDVLNKKIVVCASVENAVLRFLDDLNRSKESAFEYYFDEEKVKRVIGFISLLKHSKGELAGDNIVLEGWQEFIIANVYGWLNKKTKLRRFKTAYVQVARKNGKSTMLAAIANYHFFADSENGAEVYFLATKKSQAAIAYKEARHQIKSNKTLKTKVSIYQTELVRKIEDDTAKMLPMSRDSKGEDGHNPSFICVDEYHAHPDNELRNVMENGTLARRQPLTFIITTAGFNIGGVCYKEYEYVKQILNKTVIDEKYFAIIFEPDEADDWISDDAIKKANPNLDISVEATTIKDKIKTALQQPHQQTEVKTKLLNIWTQASTIWIPQEKWKALNKKREYKEKMVCCGAMDLANNTDLASYTLCFLPTKDFEYFSILTRYFMPKETIIERSKKDRVPYDTWAKQGYITLTEGDILDFDIIKNSILKDKKYFNLIEMGYDEWNATYITTKLTNEGLKMIPIPQRFSKNGLSACVKTFSQYIDEKKVYHDNNPVTNFCINCVELRTDGNDNYIPKKPDRLSERKRIDGAVTATMAVDRAVRHYLSTDRKSVYDSQQGVIVL